VKIELGTTLKEKFCKLATKGGYLRPGIDHGTLKYIKYINR